MENVYASCDLSDKVWCLELSFIELITCIKHQNIVLLVFFKNSIFIEIENFPAKRTQFSPYKLRVKIHPIQALHFYQLSCGLWTFVTRSLYSETD